MPGIDRKKLGTLSGWSRVLLHAVVPLAGVFTLAWVLLHDANMTRALAIKTQEDYRGVFFLSSDDILIRFERDAGSGRPYINSPAQTVLMEYTDWDYSSTIIVDGVQSILYLHAHGYANDPSKNIITHTMRGNGWELVKEVEILTDRTVEVRFYFIARAPNIRQVRLTLGHYKWYYQEINRHDNGFSAQVGSLSRQQHEEGLTERPEYEVTLEARTPLAPVRNPIRTDKTTPWGVSNIITIYQTMSPRWDMRTLLAAERISYRSLLEGSTP